VKNKGMSQYRFDQNPIEESFAIEWEKENSSRDGRSVLDYLLAEYCNCPRGEVTDRDRQVAATAIQWLGSHVGQSFLENVGNKIKK